MNRGQEYYLKCLEELEEKVLDAHKRIKKIKKEIRFRGTFLSILAGIAVGANLNAEYTPPSLILLNILTILMSILQVYYMTKTRKTYEEELEILEDEYYKLQD